MMCQIARSDGESKEEDLARARQLMKPQSPGGAGTASSPLLGRPWEEQQGTSRSHPSREFALRTQNLETTRGAGLLCMDFLLTWNCTHINNAETIAGLTAALAAQGHRCSTICTPKELMGK